MISSDWKTCRGTRTNPCPDTESTSGITATTKQSNAITEITDMRDTKSMNPESVITDQDQEEFVEKNEILLQLYAFLRTRMSN